MLFYAQPICLHFPDYTHIIMSFLHFRRRKCEVISKNPANLLTVRSSSKSIQKSNICPHWFPCTMLSKTQINVICDWIHASSSILCLDITKQVQLNSLFHVRLILLSSTELETKPELHLLIFTTEEKYNFSPNIINQLCSSVQCLLHCIWGYAICW